MGYERYPQNSGGYDDRDQRQVSGRDNDRNIGTRDAYGANRGGPSWGESSGSYDQPGQNDRFENGGDRQSRYRRDGGAQGYSARDGGHSQNSYGQSGSGQAKYGQGDDSQNNYRQGSYGQNSFGQGGSQNNRYGARDYGRPDMYGHGNRDRFQQSGASQGQGARVNSNPRQDYDYDNRGFFDRAGDEVRSWFGDDDAYARRDLDARYDQQRYGAASDDHYNDWRRSQIESLDRDYDEYRQENRSKFDSEFGSWRTQRQTQRGSLSQVTEHMDVVGSDGEHVGTVDKVRGDRILLTKNDADAGGKHHSIPSRWIQTVDDKVTISKTANDAKAHWRDEERNQAFFGDDSAPKDEQGNKDPGILGRSFSGTY